MIRTIRSDEVRPGMMFSTNGATAGSVVLCQGGGIDDEICICSVFADGSQRFDYVDPSLPVHIWEPDPLDTVALADQAFTLGRAHGVSAGSWIIDGNSTEETARAILTGYEDGDPAIMDLEPAPLSGEWADSPTPSTLADALELPEEYRGSELDQLCTDYELGFSEGFWAEVTRSAAYLIGDDAA